MPKISVDAINYSQDSIRSTFLDGQSIYDNRNRHSVIEVYEDRRRRLWALNNRTLWWAVNTKGWHTIRCVIRTDENAAEECNAKRRGGEHECHNGGEPYVRGAGTDDDDGDTDDSDGGSFTWDGY